MRVEAASQDARQAAAREAAAKEAKRRLHFLSLAPASHVSLSLSLLSVACFTGESSYTHCCAHKTERWRETLRREARSWVQGERERETQRLQPLLCFFPPESLSSSQPVSRVAGVLRQPEREREFSFSRSREKDERKSIKRRLRVEHVPL